MDGRLLDEMILSDLVGALTPTQSTQAMPLRRKRHDRVDISSVNIVKGMRGKHRASSFTPRTGARRKRK